MNVSQDKIVLTACLSPAIQRTELIHSFEADYVNRVMESHIDAAGKGIGVSRVLRQLGIPNFHITHGGTNSDELQRLLNSDGIEAFLAPNDSSIRNCITIISKDPSQVTEIVEPSNPVNEKVFPNILKHWREKLTEACIVSISGSVAPGYPKDAIAQLTEIAIQNEAVVILDTRGEELLEAFKFLPHIVKVNISEFTKTFLPDHAGSIELSESENLEEHKKLIEETLIDLTEDTRTTIIITRGPKPIWFANKGSYGIFEPRHIAKHKILNPIGSGDAFAAGIAASLHAQIEEIDFSEGLSYARTIEALKVAEHCAHENAKLIRPSRIL